jgi:hypothetical protein
MEKEWSINHIDIKPYILNILLEYKIVNATYNELIEIIKTFNYDKHIKLFIYDNIDKIIVNNFYNINHKPKERIMMNAAKFIVDLLEIKQLSFANKAIKQVFLIAPEEYDELPSEVILSWEIEHFINDKANIDLYLSLFQIFDDYEHFTMEHYMEDLDNIFEDTIPNNFFPKFIMPLFKAALIANEKDLAYFISNKLNTLNIGLSREISNKIFLIDAMYKIKYPILL